MGTFGFRGVVFCVFLTGLAVMRAEQSRTAVSPAAVTKEVSCTCTSVPFVPDPPCAAQCTLRFLKGVPATRLASTLKLSPAASKAVSTIKDKGVSQAEFEQFVVSPQGREFQKALESTKKQDLAVFVAASDQSKPPGARNASKK